ncbi:S-layer homology domain-containing protein [Aneurinibacillus terranovensis]|uniref:S-layer homology domain-containing protein n=1 Tax=Aneurinibacillus terranovensis TaxID=278991 RepID=UPI00041374DF|nr:S-layer homology domain-containing protein [Aneurinibacillus terranovensis]
MKRALKMATFGTIVAATAFTPLFAYAESFKDIPANHWAKNTITWGTQNHVVHGYPDGTFHPDNQVSEDEFLAMLVNSFAGVQAKTDARWDSGYYAFAQKMNYPTQGADNLTARGWKINRGQVAEILAGATGVNYTGDDAVKYLLAKGLAKGKDPSQVSIEAYKASDYLTRAEAVQFIKTAKQQGLTELRARPAQPSDPALIPPLSQLAPPVPQPAPQPTNPTIEQNLERAANALQNPNVPDGTIAKYARLLYQSAKGAVVEGDKVKITLPPIEKGYLITIGWGTGHVDYGTNTKNPVVPSTVEIPKTNFFGMGVYYQGHGTSGVGDAYAYYNNINGIKVNDILIENFQK